MWKIRAKLASILRMVMQVRKSSVQNQNRGSSGWARTGHLSRVTSRGGDRDVAVDERAGAEGPELFVLERTEDGVLGGAQK